MIIKIEIDTGDNWKSSDTVVKLMTKAGETVEKVINKALKEGVKNDDKI